MTFLETSLDDAIRRGCDTVQYKHDGMFVMFRVWKNMLLPENRYGSTEDMPFSVPYNGEAVLIGTFHPNMKERWVFDIKSQNGTSLGGENYRSRYAVLRSIVPELGGLVSIIPVHPIGMAREMWAKLPFGGAKGVVFRNSKSTEIDTVYGARFYPEVPRSL